MEEILKLSDYDTLFLDRDGVINVHRPNDYVKSWAEFKFMPGILDIFPLFAQRFKKIIVVTNQRGVGKGIMLESTLIEIHEKMIVEINKIGGRIDKIYYCIDVDDCSPYRKPNPGMGLQAKIDFPEIDFSRSLMVGDSDTDMQFGANLGMKSILV